LATLKGFTRELAKYTTMRCLEERTRNLDVAGRANPNAYFIFVWTKGRLIIKPDTSHFISIAKVSDELSRWEALQLLNSLSSVGGRHLKQVGT
jgi:hypothetical protein